MSLQNKGFWMVKGAGHVTDGRAAFDNPPRFEAKRSHQWFVDSAELEMLPNKRQAVEVSVGKSGSGIPGADIPSWGNSSGFHSVPNQFMDRLFGPETARSVNFAERNISPSGTDASVALSISHAMEDPENPFTYNGIRKVKVNHVKENNDLHASKEDDFNRASHMSTVQAYSMQSESNFISMGEPFVKEDNNVMLTGHSYSSKDVHVRLTAPIYSKGDENPSSLDHSYSKQDSNILSFSGFHDEHEILPVAQPTSNYESSYNPPSVQTSELACGKELESLNANAVTTANRTAKSRNESTSKSKPDFKASRKEAPNSFPSNVRSLISTGMLDGVPVKYVSLSREELRGIIKGSGYLCGCQSCSYSKVLNAYEFERHAGCKTKHPNNHIYFENGKTIYQIVQELRSTPESMLFDAIQTVFGAPINQKSFRIWKESFQAATRELQRIYGKEELNL